MSGRQSAATDEAIRLVYAGVTAYRAAKECGINRTTIYRALARECERQAVAHFHRMKAAREAQQAAGGRVAVAEARRPGAGGKLVPGGAKHARYAEPAGSARRTRAEGAHRPLVYDPIL